MESKTMTCPFCGKIIEKGNGWHINQCIKKYINELSDERKQEIIDYYNDGHSMIDMSKFLNLSYSLSAKILKRLGVETRNLKEAANQKFRKEKYEKTCLEHFGTPHNFSKDCSSRKEWERRLLEEEGITNVFQRESVKAQIKKTLLDKYGEDGLFEIRSKGNYIEYYIEKYGEEKGREYFEWVKQRKGAANRKEYYIEKYGKELGEIKWKERISKLGLNYHRYTGFNDKCAEILDKHNFKYEREFNLQTENRNYFYDFKLGNLIIELNGIYWHCSPKKYQANDLVKFPNNVFIKAQDKWNYDKEKCEFAQSKGFKTITIWEDEFNEELLLNILKENENEISKN